jgi:cell division protein FtsW
VLGMMPLTGVPLPFISYGSSNLIVLLAAMGLLMGVAAGGGEGERRARKPDLRAIDGGGGEGSRRPERAARERAGRA